MQELEKQGVTELKIYNIDDRLTVAAILIKNGYKVGTLKRSKTENSRCLDYYLTVEKQENSIEVR